jgi:hypothetical protein
MHVLTTSVLLSVHHILLLLPLINLRLSQVVNRRPNRSLGPLGSRPPDLLRSLQADRVLSHHASLLRTLRNSRRRSRHLIHRVSPLHNRPSSQVVNLLLVRAINLLLSLPVNHRRNLFRSRQDSPRRNHPRNRVNNRFDIRLLSRLLSRVGNLYRLRHPSLLIGPARTPRLNRVSNHLVSRRHDLPVQLSVQRLRLLTQPLFPLV